MQTERIESEMKQTSPATLLSDGTCPDCGRDYSEPFEDGTKITHCLMDDCPAVDPKWEAGAGEGAAE